MSKVRSRADFQMCFSFLVFRFLVCCRTKNQERKRGWPCVPSLGQPQSWSVSILLCDQPAPSLRPRPGFAWSLMTPARDDPNPLGRSGKSRGRLHIAPMGPPSGGLRSRAVLAAAEALVAKGGHHVKPASWLVRVRAHRGR
jgi:hypothetical protein